jgi:hypothetical protein
MHQPIRCWRVLHHVFGDWRVLVHGTWHCDTGTEGHDSPSDGVSGVNTGWGVVGLSLAISGL